MSRQIGVFCAVGIIFMAGCVSIPVKSPTQDIRQDEIDQDVRFLAQPALKGRKAGSWESHTVRRFLTERFKQYGLVPWAQCKTYEQDFRFGVNVIGVLPGSDPNLADEVVLISAHYDHLGIKKGKIHPGACDNASSVAAMLEIAESLSLSETKPRRTICFAAFDAEEMGCLGSFCFTCRDDYDDAKIAAVVNMDLLGRNLLDAVHNSLLVIGTEKYPDLERQIAEFGGQADLKILPFVDSLIGPCGDHAAFFSGKRPVLFFTCGIYRDYHEPTDTPDKLDFEKLQKETAVVSRTVRFLADNRVVRNTDNIEQNNQQTRTLSYILGQIQENQEIFNLDPNSTEKLNELIKQAQADLSSDLSPAKRVAMQRDVLDKFLVLLKKYNPQMAQFSQGFLETGKYYSLYPEASSAACRKVISHYLKNGVPLFAGEYSASKDIPLTEQDWQASHVGADRYVFGAIFPKISLTAKIGVFGKKSISFGFSFSDVFCKGSLQEIHEYILLEAFESHPGYVMEQLHIPDSDAIIKPDAAHSEQSEKNAQQSLEVLSQFRQRYPEAGDNPAITKDRLLSLTQSDNIYIAQKAIGIAYIFFKESFEEDLRQMLTDSSVDIEKRRSIVYILAKTNTQDNLLTVADVLDDTTVCPVGGEHFLDKDYPLKDHPLIVEMMPFIKEWYDKEKPKTLGQVAAERLKEETRKDFGADKKAWRRWIERHYQ